MLTAAALSKALSDTSGRRVQVVGVEQERSVYSTSFAVDDVTVHFADGRSTHLMFKDLGWDSLLPQARITKPRFLYDRRREPDVYRVMLDRERLGTARYHGTVADSTGAIGLLLEKVPGVGLYQVGDVDRWCAAAIWLRRFHLENAERVRPAVGRVPLIVHDRDYFALWATRAVEYSRDRRVQRVASNYDAVVSRLAAIDPTVIHGEFYASNVLVGDERVCPIDWEMAGFGPPLIDVAALTTGSSWSDEQRARITAAYFGGLPGRRTRDNLDACRIHLAMQWIGWSRDWSAPEEHAHDWPAELDAAADRIGI